MSFSSPSLFDFIQFLTFGPAGPAGPAVPASPEAPCWDEDISRSDGRTHIKAGKRTNKWQSRDELFNFIFLQEVQEDPEDQ